MAQIIKLNGTDKKLYQLVGPLVMDPEVLHFNNNYPFKTGAQYTWFIAVERRKVVAFIPLEHRKTEWIINNYYAHTEEVEATLPLLIKAVINELETVDKAVVLSAVVQSKHLPLFMQEGFETVKSWKIYHKMQKTI